MYDLQTASNRHERDFPLWLEAARLRQEGRPYSKSDFDKVIGNHDAIVGAPACFFDQDFVSLYPGVKIVLVSRDANVKIVDKFLQKIFSPFWRQFDPAYFGHIYEFLTLLAKSDNELCQNSEQFISDTVGEKNLLKIHNDIAWAPLCEFLGVRVPGAAEPELDDATTEALLAARPFRAAFEKVKQTAHSMTVWATNILKMVTIASASVLAVFVGTVLLVKLFLLLNVLVRGSLVRDVTRLFTAVVALGGLLCGFIAGYSLAVVRNPPAVTVASPTSPTSTSSTSASASLTVDSPRREYQRKNKWGRRKGRQDRDSQIANKQNIRPERTVLSAWMGAEDNIHQDDARVREQARATHTESPNERPATFNVTHKQTEAQGVPSNGPRKVLAVTKETI